MCFLPFVFSMPHDGVAEGRAGVWAILIWHLAIHWTRHPVDTFA